MLAMPALIPAEGLQDEIGARVLKPLSTAVVS